MPVEANFNAKKWYEERVIDSGKFH